MTKWQTFMETIKTYRPPVIAYCKACGHVIPDPVGRNGQPVKFCNDECRSLNNREHKNAYERRRKLALRKTQTA